MESMFVGLVVIGLLCCLGILYMQELEPYPTDEQYRRYEKWKRMPASIRHQENIRLSQITGRVIPEGMERTDAYEWPIGMKAEFGLEACHRSTVATFVEDWLPHQQVPMVRPFQHWVFSGFHGSAQQQLIATKKIRNWR